jgi:hypothetical protein
VYFVTIWYILWLFGVFCDHLVYFMAIWYILWLFGIFYGYLVYFSRFGILYQSGNPDQAYPPSGQEVSLCRSYLCAGRIGLRMTAALALTLVIAAL